jgi:hypothetical protein
MSQISENEFAYLADQFKTARPILFTGAGFSLGVKNIVGSNVPSYTEVKEGIWKLCFPDKEVSEESSVQDIYDLALTQKRGVLTHYLKNNLTIDAESIPSWYRDIFNFPWYKAYTLNIDDLEIATSRKHQIGRKVVALSATIEKAIPNIDLLGAETLKVIHLNGIIEDIPDNSTFSTTQYAARLSKLDPWYTNFVNELLVYPVIFIGTSLNEPALWQHLELKKKRVPRGEGEHRSKSFLVKPSLDPAKEGLLSFYNVVHIPMTAEEFTTELISRLSPALEEGRHFIKQFRRDSGSAKFSIPMVSSLLTELNKKTDYLLGAFPQWADIHQKRAIIRKSDDTILATCQVRLKLADNRGVIAITGTAGSGKSTAVMRAAYALNAQGKVVGWLDRDSEYDSHSIREFLENNPSIDVLCIDDAETLGMEITSFLVELSKKEKSPLVVFSITATKIDRLINATQLGKTSYTEITIPLLADSDIDDLIGVLRVSPNSGF